MERHIIFIFPIFNGPYGGERHCLKLADALVKSGHTVEIWTLRFHKSCASMLNPRITLHVHGAGIPRIHSLAVLASFFAMPALAARVRRAVRNPHNISVVGMGWQSAFGLAKLRKYFPSRIYYTLEPPRFLYDLKQQSLLSAITTKTIGMLIKYLDKKSVKAIPTILANSNWTQDQVREIYERESVIIYPGLEKKRFTSMTKDEARRRTGIPAADHLYISVGKLHQRKRIDRAMAYFVDRERNSTAQFIIIGRGPEEAALKREVEKLREDPSTAAAGKRITFLGERSDEEVATYLRASDFFLFTAKDEPFGIVILEAKAAGCIILPDDRDLPVLSWEESADAFMHALP